MNVAIIGCGLIGQKRAMNLKNAKLVAVVDPIREKAENIARTYPECHIATDWRNIIDHPHIDIVIIATPHNTLAEIALSFAKVKKHILIEKPAARTAKELIPLINAAKESGSLIRVGFNHRYHRALQKAREIILANTIGELLFIRGRYGHGGRLGYEQEWRAKPAISGGGELIDQGIHLIDLARWFLGDFCDIQGKAHTYYWDMPVDDNSFLLLTTSKKQVAFLHASCTEWKNLFSFEIVGQHGKIDISGLGGSYGVERLTLYKMTPAMGPPDTTIFEYPMHDNSWEIEFAEFMEDIQQNRQPAASLHDAVNALNIVEHIYKVSHYDYCT